MTAYPSNDPYNPSNTNNNNAYGSNPQHSNEPTHSDSSHMIPQSETPPPSVPYGYQGGSYGSQNNPSGSQNTSYESQSPYYGSTPSQGHTGSQEASAYGSESTGSYNSSDMYGYGGNSLQPSYGSAPQNADMQGYNNAQQYYPGGHGGVYTAQSPTNTMSLLSLIISCASIFTGGIVAIVGVILGHIGLKQIKETGESGRGLALAGLIVGYVQVAFVVLFVILFFLLMLVGIAGA